MTTGRAEGDLIVRATLAGTALFTLVATAAAIAPDRLAAPAAIVDLVLFAVGSAAFAAALWRAAARSRREELSVAGLFLLSGSAPPGIRRTMLGALAVQVVVALVTAAVRPFTPLAFGVLVPTFGLGACGLWSARRGSFPRRGRPAARSAPTKRAG